MEPDTLDSMVRGLIVCWFIWVAFWLWKCADSLRALLQVMRDDLQHRITLAQIQRWQRNGTFANHGREGPWRAESSTQFDPQATQPVKPPDLHVVDTERPPA